MEADDAARQRAQDYIEDARMRRFAAALRLADQAARMRDRLHVEADALIAAARGLAAAGLHVEAVTLATGAAVRLAAIRRAEREGAGHG